MFGPSTPAATAVGTDLPAEQFPGVTGGFGEAPTISFPSTPAPPKLQRKILVEGTGAELKAGDQLVANYYGIVWGGSKPFDSSYERGKPSVFQIGVRQVVSGWDVGLVGLKVGTRVLLTLSPSDGYGTAGKAPDITGTDTLVFVIDVVETLGSGQFGQSDAAVQPAPADAPVVTGAPGTAPDLTIPAGLAEPKEIKLDVLAKGTGAPVAFGELYVQLGAWDWTGALQQATWKQAGPTKVTLTASVAALAKLVGVPVGSRVLVQIPADESQGSPASAIVLDVLYQ